MCYSAQVNQMIRRLQRELGVRMDYDEALKLFLRRLDDPGISISRGFEANFAEPANDPERRIKAAIDEHRGRCAIRFQQDLFAQKTRLVNAERTLKDKETKKAREDVRIATHKIQSLTAKLSDLQRSVPTDMDDRIFPLMYAGVIIHQHGENLLTPMRYHCRPLGKPAFYDKKFPGLYNARRDNLERFWVEQFGHHHAVMIVDSFFENVALHVKEHRILREGEKEQNLVLKFTPNPPQPMTIACLWSQWTDPSEPDLRGFAAITDEPPVDVAAAGHDRCIVNLRPGHVAAWLTPESRSRAALQVILSDHAVSTYEHAALEAA